MLRFAAIAALLALSAAGLARPATAAAREFPQSAVDYFAAMDDGVKLSPDEVRGRNTWLIWTAGNEAFWDYLARRSFGAFDLLKVLDSRNRATRFSYYGLMNEPGFKPATAPDAFGLWLDTPDGSQDGAFAADYRESFARDDFLRTYGRASGIVGLRLYPNPDFDAKARRRWDPRRFYDEPAYYRDPKLVRPYRVGMACGFCHVGPHPLHPPADPENPEWQNLSSNIGAQYLKPARVFVLPGQEDNFLFQVVNSMPPGTIDTSALATDNINNPRTMNAIYEVGVRIATGAQETLSGGNLDLPGTTPKMKVPHVLKDGADSVGILGALARVYVSIGASHEEWLKHFNLLVGGKPQTPFPVAQAKKNSPYVRATLDRLPNLAAFFVTAAKPQPLARAPGGERYLQDSDATVARGQQVFAENCAACHVSQNKMPPPPPGLVCYTPAWADWTRSDEFKRQMAELVRAPDFLNDNYLSTDCPYPVSLIGSNACSTLASNALGGHIWDNFSSDTYKHRPNAGRHHRRHRSVHRRAAALRHAGRRPRLSAGAIAGQPMGVGALSAQQFGGPVQRRPVGRRPHAGVPGRHREAAVAGEAAGYGLDLSHHRDQLAHGREVLFARVVVFGTQSQGAWHARRARRHSARPDPERHAGQSAGQYRSRYFGRSGKADRIHGAGAQA